LSDRLRSRQMGRAHLSGCLTNRIDWADQLHPQAYAELFFTGMSIDIPS
jgi:hypothetical protein